MSQKYTIRDIAEKAGVSHTTVSLVLNNKDNRVSPETKKKILSIAHELNYTPNQIAVSLATQKTYTIGLITPDLTNMYLSSIASGVEMYAQSQGYSVFFCNSNESVEKCVNYIQQFIKRNIDGIIIIPPSDINEGDGYIILSKALEECGIPYILVDRAVLHLFHDFVTIDNQLGGYLATTHLLQLGHKRIGCITGPLTEFGAYRRCSGYKEALQEAGIPIDEALIYEGNYHFDSGEKGALELLSHHVTAIFACNDMMALGVNKVAADSGLRIPQDLSIVGFDNNPIVNYMSFSLTTINQPSVLMGKEACKLLLRRMTAPDNPHKDYFFSPSLIVRNSTAAPKHT